MSVVCPLCGSGEGIQIVTSDQKAYRHCPECDLVSLEPQHFLSLQEEEHRYRQHENVASDPGYQAYSAPLIESIRRLCGPGTVGLDFGCGQDPVSAYLLRPLGHVVRLYDPVFWPETASLSDETYDFIILSETIEHLREPKKVLERLIERLRSGGFLFIMTQHQPRLEAFDKWYYRSDPTHVAFYSMKVFNWISDHFKLSTPTQVGERVVYMQKCAKA